MSLLCMRNICKSFNGIPVLKQVELTIEKGEVHALLGENGAGKSTALKMLEDMGYFCVDNLPVPLIPKFAELLAVPGTEMNKAALGVDIRSGQNFYELKKIGVVMKKAQYFITCKELPLQMQTVNELSPQRVRKIGRAHV